MRSNVTPTAIDGTHASGRAPEPSFGLVLAVYRTVEAYGLASESEVYELLPAAIEKSSQVVTKKKVHATLYSAVYAGYLCTDKGKYKVAPIEYYTARQRIIAALDGKKRAPRKNPSQLLVSASDKFQLHPYLALSFVLVVFTGGAVGGFLVGWLVNF